MPADDFEPRVTRRLGTVLHGKYRLDAVLGVGGMAVVYAATHRNQKRFAVKMLHPELSMDPEIRGRFLREGYVANTVDHPGAVAVLDDDMAEDGAAFLVMELLHGRLVEDLRHPHGRLPLKVIAPVIDQLLLVLEAAHAKSIVHRDIKPGNLFVTADGTVKVLDFGIARVRDAAGGGGQFATTTGALLGTPAFMAPEQAGGRSSLIDPTTDLWAVGASMFTLLSGDVVHSGETVQELIVRAATRAARSLLDAVPDAPPRIAGIVDRALAFENSRRWPTAGAMRDALREAHLSLFGHPIGRPALPELVAWSESANPPASREAAPPEAHPPDVRPRHPADADPQELPPPPYAPIPTPTPLARSVHGAVEAPGAGAQLADPVREPLPPLPLRRLGVGPAALGAIAVLAAGAAAAVVLRPRPSAPVTIEPPHAALAPVTSTPPELPPARSAPPPAADLPSAPAPSAPAEIAPPPATRVELAPPPTAVTLATAPKPLVRPRSSVDAGGPKPAPPTPRERAQDWDKP